LRVGEFRFNRDLARSIFFHPGLDGFYRARLIGRRHVNNKSSFIAHDVASDVLGRQYQDPSVSVFWALERR
jgi:hypothetical protein